MRKEQLKQLKHLASLLPVIPLRLQKGKWIRMATNHQRQLIKAFKEGGREAVEQYVEEYKVECMAWDSHVKSMQQGDNNIINLNNQLP